MTRRLGVTAALLLEPARFALERRMPRGVAAPDGAGVAALTTRASRAR